MTAQCVSSIPVKTGLHEFTNQLLHAYTAPDEPVMQRLIADSYLATLPSGVHVDKQQWIAGIKAAFKQNTYDGFEMREE
jgi:hypothetical protein